MRQNSYILNDNGHALIKPDLSDIELKKVQLTDSLSEVELGTQEKDKFINDGNGIVNEEAPIDKNKLVYIIFIIHGIGALLPWNSFINAKPYFTDYKLNVSLTDPIENATLANYRDRFMPIESLSSQIPNLLFNGLNLFLAYYSSSTGGSNLFKLITASIIVNIVIMSFTTTLVLIDTSAWPLKFFLFTIISIVLLNISNGFYQNSIYGAAAKLPNIYSNAVVIGNNICGTMVSFVSIFTIFISPDLKTATFLYFLSSIIVLFACLITFKKLINNKFYQYHSKGGSSSTTQTNTRPSYIYILKHCGEQCFNVYLTFFVTLLLFPSILSTTAQNDETFFSSKYYTPVFCFLNFNFFAMIGNLLPGFIKCPSKRLWIPVCLRLLFIPFFLFCNYKNSVYPVYFAHDCWFIIGVLLLGLSHGYLSSLGMMFAPEAVSKEHAPIAGMLSAFCLMCGISSGLAAALLF